MLAVKLMAVRLLVVMLPATRLLAVKLMVVRLIVVRLVIVTITGCCICCNCARTCIKINAQLLHYHMVVQCLLTFKLLYEATLPAADD